MVQRLSITLVLSLLTACTAGGWERPGMTQPQLRQDQDECTRWAQDVGPPAWRDIMFDRCMNARGYRYK
jgi:hypothetical protein